MKRSPKDSEVAAAIAVALHLYLDGDVHDFESGVVTIVRNPSSQWCNRAMGFRRTPVKH